jgi:hypothetical protein
MCLISGAYHLGNDVCKVIWIQEGNTYPVKICDDEWDVLTGIAVPTDRPIKVNFSGCKVVG